MAAPPELDPSAAAAWHTGNPALAPRGELGQYAGFWRRYWARGITAYVWALASGAVTAGIAALTLFITSSTRSDTLLALGGAFAFVANLLVFHLVWAKPLHRHSATIGMRQMGLQVHVTGSPAPPTASTALLRSVLGLLPSILAGAVPYTALLADSDGAQTVLIIVLVAATVLQVLGGLWMLVSARRQTAWDVVARTEVSIAAPPSWIALVAFLLGTAIPSVAAFTVSKVGVDQVRDAFEARAGFADIAEVFVPAIPALIVSAITIAVSLVALRSTAWDAERRAGRGLARTGLFFGWSIPAVLVVTLLFGVIYAKIGDETALSCKEERAKLRTALDSYRTLNGTDPDIGNLGQPIYLDDPTVAERWRISGGTISPVGECRQD